MHTIFKTFCLHSHSLVILIDLVPPGGGGGGTPSIRQLLSCCACKQGDTERWVPCSCRKSTNPAQNFKSKLPPLELASSGSFLEAPISTITTRLGS